MYIYKQCVWLQSDSLIRYTPHMSASSYSRTGVWPWPPALSSFPVFRTNPLSPGLIPTPLGFFLGPEI